MTTNRNPDIARRYHAGTRHSHRSVISSRHYLDFTNKPVPFKLYRSLAPIRLPTDFRPVSTPALDAIATVDVERTGECIPDLRTMAHLLYLSAGIIRSIRYAGGEIDFRAASCTGALYHIEVYLVCGDLPGLEAGVYHFGPADFALRRLRSGDWRSVVVDATGSEPSMASAPVVAVLTSTFWRNAWKYQSRAYRHAFWDGGTILANLLATATACDLPSHVVLGYADDTINQLVGADGSEEASICLVSLGRTESRPAALPGPLIPITHETEPLSPGKVDYPDIVLMHQASSLGDGDEARSWRAANGLRRDESHQLEGATPLALLAADQAGPDSLEAVVRRRGSTRRFAQAPIAFAQLSTLLDCTTRGVAADFLDPPGASLNDLYLIVNDVQGLESGSYAYDRNHGGLRQLRTGALRREAGYLALGQDLARDAAVNVYMLTDLEAVLRQLGNRGYRAAQLEGGIIGGKLYLGAYAQRLGCTGLTFFDDDVTQFFSPDATGKAVMFLAAIGRSAVRGQR